MRTRSPIKRPNENIELPRSTANFRFFVLETSFRANLISLSLFSLSRESDEIRLFLLPPPVYILASQLRFLFPHYKPNFREDGRTFDTNGITDSLYRSTSFLNTC